MTSQFAVTAVLDGLNMCSVITLSSTAVGDFSMLKSDSTENTFYYLLADFFNRDAVTGVILP